MTKRKLVIFGTGDIAQLAHFYFTTDSNFEVVGFTVDKSYIKDPSFCGLPVVPFEDVQSNFPSGHYDFFVGLSYAKLNSVRRDKYLAAKSMGYRLVSYVSSHSRFLTREPIGENCFILEDTVIQPFVKIGNNVTLWSGAFVGHHSVIHDHTFVAPRVAISGGVEVGEQCFVGVNATVRNHVKVGDRCVIGAGTLILSDAAPEGVYIGAATERSGVPSEKLRDL